MKCASSAATTAMAISGLISSIGVQLQVMGISSDTLRMSMSGVPGIGAKRYTNTHSTVIMNSASSVRNVYLSIFRIVR